MTTYAIDYVAMNNTRGTLVTTAKDEEMAFGQFRDLLGARRLVTASLQGSPRVATLEDRTKAEELTAALIPCVGMGVTQYCGTGRYAYTVIQVLTSKKLVVQRDKAMIVSQDAVTGENQVYTFSRDESGEIVDISLRKNGHWCEVGEGSVRGFYFKLGERRQYIDPGC